MLLRKKMPTFMLAIVFFISTKTCLVLGGYSRADVEKLHPNLGKDFVIFQDDNKGTVVGYLKPSVHSIFEASNVVSRNQVTFTLYTRANTGGSTFSTYTDVPKSFNKAKKTIFIIHGWESSGTSNHPITVKNAYLRASDVNVFIVDWSKIAKNVNYLVPMKRTNEVGAYVAGLLNHLVRNLGTNSANLHLVGHSLGAHVAGFAARAVTSGKVGRVTGLDPALPGFTSNANRLKSSDASFVDIIHTCAGYLGLKDAIGHADFYPNGGGPPQPGCSVLSVSESCSHRRSWLLFADSISLKFQASKCNSANSINKNSCQGAKALMGEPTPSGTRGVFYLETTGKEPFVK